MRHNKDFRAKREPPEFNLLDSVKERTAKVGRYTRYLESSRSWREAAAYTLMIKALIPNLEYSLRVASIFANRNNESYSPRDVAAAYLNYLGKSSLNLSGNMRIFEDKLEDIMPGVPLVYDNLREQPIGGVILDEPSLEVTKVTRAARNEREARYGRACNSKIDLIGHITLDLYNAEEEIEFSGFDLAFMKIGSVDINQYISEMTEQYGVERARHILADVALMESVYVPGQPDDPLYGEINFGMLKS